MTLSWFRATAIGLTIWAASNSNATAAVVNVIYTGYVTMGTDTAGLFGLPNSSLYGDAFTVNYTFDTMLGSTLTSPDQNYARGGLASLNTSPAISAIVTINGRSLSIAGAFYGDTEGYSSQYYSTQFQEAKTSPYLYVDNSIIGAPGAISPSIVNSFTYNAATGDNSFGSLMIGDGVTQQVNASFYNSQEQIVGIASSVPEASTWLMMLLGFGGMGALAYRKVRKDYDAATFA